MRIIIGIFVVLCVIGSVSLFLTADNEPRPVPESEPQPVPESEPQPAAESEPQAQTKPKEPIPPKYPRGFDASPKTQRKRKDFIDKMIREGYWVKTEANSIPEVWVTDKWLNQSERSQKATLGLAYAYWMCELDTFGFLDDNWDTMVVKMDDGTELGKRIAIHDPGQGIRPE